MHEQAERPEFVEVMAGNSLLPGMEPAAHCYCGHQFGNFAGQLGDGAVTYLGEVFTWFSADMCKHVRQDRSVCFQGDAQHP